MEEHLGMGLSDDGDGSNSARLTRDGTRAATHGYTKEHLSKKRPQLSGRASSGVSSRQRWSAHCFGNGVRWLRWMRDSGPRYSDRRKMACFLGRTDADRMNDWYSPRNEIEMIQNCLLRRDRRRHCVRGLFCSRDGIKRYSLVQISYERRNHYRWLGYWPQRLLVQEYPAWASKHFMKNVLR